MANQETHERISYNRLQTAIRDEITTQIRQFGARARCTAADLDRRPDSQYSTDFIEVENSDVLCTHQPYTHPRKPSQTLDGLNSGNYEAPLMFYLSKKKFLHNFVNAHFRENPRSTYEEAAEAFNRLA